jgi:hypothetical protein
MIVPPNHRLLAAPLIGLTNATHWASGNAIGHFDPNGSPQPNIHPAESA